MSAIPEGAINSNGRGGCLISTLATPRASRNALAAWHDGRLKVALAAPPVDGEANKVLVRFMAEILGVPKSAVSVASGLTGRRKVVEVSALSVESAKDILQKIL